MRKKISCFQSLVLCLSFFSILSFSEFSFSKDTKARVINEGAVVKLQPNIGSQTILFAPLGSEFDVEERVGEWLKIKLPPNKDGIIQTGYINISYVEYKPEVELQKKNILTPPNLEINQRAPIRDENYINWSGRLSKAKAKVTTGSIITFVGAVILAPSVAYTFYNQWPSSIEARSSLSGGAWTIVIIGDVLGVAGLVGGLALITSGSSQVSILKEEGQIKGYLSAGVIPKFRAVGFQIGVAF
jgi:hypothetical protein